jgi:hypothetical protein
VAPRSRLGCKPRADVERNDASALGDERPRHAAYAAAGVEHQLTPQRLPEKPVDEQIGSPSQVVVVHEIVEAIGQSIV